MDGGAIRRCRAIFAIDLHPSHSASALTGIREQLNAWLLRWNHDLGGIMLSYTNLHLQSSEARIHPYFPFFHVDVAADVDLFCPESGHTLSGRVNKIGPDYVGLLVLGVFNAAIGRQNIRTDFVYQPLANSFSSQKHPEHVIEEGSEVIFTVHLVQNEMDFFSLTGKLMSKSTTGVETYLRAILAEEHRKTRKKRIEEPTLRSIAQLEQPDLQQSDASEHQRQVHIRVQRPSARITHVGNKQAIVDSAAAVSGRASLTEESREKRKRRRDTDTVSMQAAANLDTPGNAVKARAEPSADDLRTPGHTISPLDVPVRSESEALHGKLSKKQRKALGISTPDVAASTPGTAAGAQAERSNADLLTPGQAPAADVPYKCESAAPQGKLSKRQRKSLGICTPGPAASTPVPSITRPSSAGLQHPGQAPAAAAAADVAFKSETEARLSEKERMRLGISVPNLTTARSVPVKAESEAAADVPVMTESEAQQGKSSKKHRSKPRTSAPNLAAATSLPVKAEPGAESAILQLSDHPASAPGADIAGLSKKERKRLRASMPGSAVLSGMSASVGVKSDPISMQGLSHNTPDVADNGIAVKEEGGRGSLKRQNGQHKAQVKTKVKTELLPNGHSHHQPYNCSADSLPGSSRKHKGAAA